MQMFLNRYRIRIAYAMLIVTGSVLVAANLILVTEGGYIAGMYLVLTAFVGFLALSDRLFRTECLFLGIQALGRSDTRDVSRQPNEGLIPRVLAASVKTMTDIVKTIGLLVMHPCCITSTQGDPVVNTQSILITGASGKTGRRISTTLLEHGYFGRPGTRSAPIPFDWDNQATWANGLKDVSCNWLPFQGRRATAHGDAISKPCTWPLRGRGRASRTSWSNGPFRSVAPAVAVSSN
jgi:hypothetical protein